MFKVTLLMSIFLINICCQLPKMVKMRFLRKLLPISTASPRRCQNDFSEVTFAHICGQPAKILELSSLNPLLRRWHPINYEPGANLGGAGLKRWSPTMLRPETCGCSAQMPKPDHPPAKRLGGAALKRLRPFILRLKIYRGIA